MSKKLPKKSHTQLEGFNKLLHSMAAFTEGRIPKFCPTSGLTNSFQFIPNKKYPYQARVTCQTLFATVCLGR